MKKLVWLVIIVIVLGGVWWFGQNQTPATTDSETVKVGLLTPLTGDAAVYGEFIKKGVACAEKLINQDGGVNGHPLSIVSEDSQCEGAVGVTAINKLIHLDKVNAVVGEACSSAAIPESEIASENEVVLIASAVSNPQFTQNEFSFRVNPNDLQQGKGLAEYIRFTLQAGKVGILAMNDEYGQGLVAEFSGNFEDLGGEVADIQWFAPDSSDYRTQITKLKQETFSVLFIIAAPAQHPVIASQLSELATNWSRVADFNFGTLSPDSQNESMKGTFYPITPFDEEGTAQAQFLTDCMMAEFSEDANVLSAWGFDSLYVFSKAAQNCPTFDGQCIKQNLEGLDFDGAYGRNQITQERELANIRFEFVELE